jgi:hypothetical protein
MPTSAEHGHHEFFADAFVLADWIHRNRTNTCCRSAEVQEPRAHHFPAFFRYEALLWFKLEIAASNPDSNFRYGKRRWKTMTSTDIAKSSNDDSPRERRPALPRRIMSLVSRFLDDVSA